MKQIINCKKKKNGPLTQIILEPLPWTIPEILKSKPSKYYLT